MTKNIVRLLIAGLSAMPAVAVAQPLQNVVFGLPLPTGNTAYCFFSLAERLGYFKDEGLSVKMQNVGGSVQAAQAIIAGQVDIAGVTPEPVFKLASDGGDLTMFYNWARKPTGSIGIPVDSTIKTIEDLRGKKLGAQSLAAGNILLTNAILSQQGIDPKEVTYLSVGVGAQALQALRSGYVDAFVLSDSNYAQLENAGAKLRYMYGPDQEKLFSIAFVMKRSRLDNEPKLAIGFGRAIARATIAAKENPEACIRAFWLDYPTARVAGMAEAEQLRNDLRIVMKRQELLETPAVKEAGWGSYQEEDVKAWNAFAARGVIPAPLSDLGKVYTNKYIAEINKFDPVKAAEDGKNFKVAR